MYFDSLENQRKILSHILVTLLNIAFQFVAGPVLLCSCAGR